MQERPPSGEGQLSVCPYCDSTIVDGQAHDCSEMGENPTLGVGALPKVAAELLREEPAAEVVPPAISVTASQTARGKTSSAAIRTMQSQPEGISASAGASGDEIHGLIIDGRYEVLEKASQGGMGTVYKARHATLRNLLAVKILRRPKDEVSRRRFLQEAQLLSQIKHPNIVQVIDFGELPSGKSYLAMEFLSGPTLTAAVREGQMTPLRACRIAAQIARGMHHVHEQNIVHRDLKPDNILLVNQDGNEDFVKIIDFGIAKDVRAVPGLQVSGQMRVSASSIPTVSDPKPVPEPEDISLDDTSSHSLTQAGQLVGTPLYMAPEQIRSGLHDAKGDQYALGCIVYFMLTGQPVFTGRKPNDIMSAHVKQKVVPPRQRVPGLQISDALEAVVLRALAKDPEQRFPSMRALEEALESCIRALSGDAVPSADQARRQRLRRMIPWAIVAAVGLVGLIVYVVLSRRAGDEEISQPELLALRGRALAVLTKQAGSTDPRLKLGALRALGLSRDGTQRALLEQRMDESEPSVAAQAAEALGLLGEPSAATGLLQRSGRVSDPSVRTAMAVALERLGEPRGTQLLYDGLAGKDGELRLLSALLLCDRGNRTAVELLLSVLEKGQVGGPIELSVLGCLARAGNEQAYKALLVKLQQPEPRETQLRAAQQLIPLGETRAQTLLVRLASEPGRDQLLAARYLASAEHGETAQVFRAVLRDGKASSTATILASEGLGLSGKLLDVRLLDRQLDAQAEPQVQLAAAEAIVRLAATDVRLMSERSLLWARDALSSGSWSIRQAGVATLGDRQEAEAGPLIVSMLRDPVSQVRRAAVRALVRRSEVSALPVLKEQLSDSDATVRLESLQALVRLAKRFIDAGQRPAVESVSSWLRDVVQKGSASERVVARSGLLLLGDTSQKSVLKDLVGSSDEETRKLMAEQPGADTEILSMLLSDASEAVRFVAARRLAERGDQSAKTVLRQMAQKGSGEAVTAAVLLNRLGEKTEQPQLRSISQASLPVEKRMQMVESVQNLDVSVALPVLLSAARDPEPLVRRLVVEVASDLPGSTVRSTPGLPVLQLLASDTDAAVRTRVWGIMARLEQRDEASPATMTASSKPTSKEPASEEPTSKEPASKEPASKEPASDKARTETDPSGTDAVTGGQGKLTIEAAPGTLIQIDDKPWQNAATFNLAAGKHVLRSLGGVRTVEIVSSQTLSLKLPESEAELLLRKGVDVLARSDYRQAQKLFDKAHGQCKKNKALATPCELIAFEGGYHLATALEHGNRLPEAMMQYQKLTKGSPKGKARAERRSEILAAVGRLSQQMGEVVISGSKKGKCQQSSVWVLPGTHIISVDGKSQQVQVSAQQRLEVGSCK